MAALLKSSSGARWARALTLPAVAACALLLPGSAQADADTFIAHLAAEGITDSNGPAGLLELGEIACADIRNGYSYVHEAKKFMEYSAAGSDTGRPTPPLTAHQGLSIAGYAVSDLCPDGANIPVTRG